MKQSGDFAGGPAVARWGIFFALWIVLIGYRPSALAAGVLVAALAAGVSLRLLPPAANRVRYGALAAFTVSFLWQSVIAGWDVARRVFHPGLPIRPGFVRHPSRLAPGARRQVFSSVTSLVPGTLKVGEDKRSMVYHCLDLDQPAARELAEQEAALLRALGGASVDGRDR